jgi:hypothetical protein
MPSPIYQYAINLVMSLPIRRGPGVLMNVSVREHCAQCAHIKEVKIEGFGQTGR